MPGRVRSARWLGSKLIFLDIERHTQRLQVMVDLKKLTTAEGVEDSFKGFKKVARVGDWICECFVSFIGILANRASRHGQPYKDLDRTALHPRAAGAPDTGALAPPPPR